MMDLGKKTVTYPPQPSPDAGKIVIVVSEASTYMGMVRAQLSYQAFKENPNDKKKLLPFHDDPVMQTLRAVTYPNLTAPVVQAKGIPWPISFEDFVALPERLINTWEAAVYELNPHWTNHEEPEEDQGKKATSSG